ncbi:MAG: hypothetical protein U0996_26390 [Planctomycetaceae bacterium]
MPSLQGDDSGLGFGVEGSSATGVGVVGKSDQGTGARGFSNVGDGVMGSSEKGRGVIGESAFHVGVFGISKQAEGVVGESPASHGVRGESLTPNFSSVIGVHNHGGTGVLGQSNTSIGVLGTSSSGNGVLGNSDIGIGVVGQSGRENGVLGRSKEANGVFGMTNGAKGSGVLGANSSTTDGNGVTGISEAAFGVFGLTNRRDNERQIAAGVGGQSNGPGWGVLGISKEGRAGVAGLSNLGDGVFGQTESDSRAGVRGTNNAVGDGVRGEGNVGVHGIQTTSLQSPGAGVLGENPVTNGVGVVGFARNGYGVAGINSGPGTFGLFGQRGGVIGQSNIGAGVTGVGFDSNPGVLAFGSPLAISTIGNIGALGTISAIGLPAATFLGDVIIAGTMKATSKQFQIDHPLDPANKYLNHASVESSEMKTLYDGMIMLDSSGAATVDLPCWFESLNSSLRYQLTPIGSPAPNLHIAAELDGNKFRIAGGSPNGRVCWQVTGVRHDRSAKADPLVVEAEKTGSERGAFLHPEHFGFSAERVMPWGRKHCMTESVKSDSKCAAASDGTPPAQT